jgi:hypothetical protein
MQTVLFSRDSLLLIVALALLSCKPGAPTKQPQGGIRASSLVNAALDVKRKQEQEQIENAAGRIAAEIVGSMDAQRKFLADCHTTIEFLGTMEDHTKADVLYTAATYNLGIATGELRADYKQAAAMLEALRTRSDEMRSATTGRRGFLSGPVGMKQIARNTLMASIEHQAPDMQEMLAEAEANSYMEVVEECVRLSMPREQRARSPLPE